MYLTGVHLVSRRVDTLLRNYISAFPRGTKSVMLLDEQLEKRLIGQSVAYAIHKAIPNSQFVAFAQSGHRLFFEAPKAFA